MDATDLFDSLLVIGLMIVVTIVYFLVRRFIAWTLEDDNKWHKKQGHLGMNKSEMNNKKKLAYNKVTFGYVLFISVLVFLLIMLVAA